MDTCVLLIVLVGHKTLTRSIKTEVVQLCPFFILSLILRLTYLKWPIRGACLSRPTWTS